MILTYYIVTTLLVIAYLLGSIPSAVWIGKRYYGVDIREHGSKNAGTTNMLRVLGRRAAIPVFALDFLKGFVAVTIIDRQMEKSKINIKGATVIVAGGYGMGSKEGFQLCYDLAEVLGAEVGASRAAVDAGFCEHERQIGQTGVTVRPKLYVACGISGQIQHTAGMDQSSMIISINSDPAAPITKIADYAITGKVEEVIPKMIKYYKQNSK